MTEAGDTGKLLRQVLDRLERESDPEAEAKVARFGITGVKCYGVATPVLKSMARELGTSRPLAEALWAVPSIETRGLAALVADPALFTREDAERWVVALDNWAVCDALCFYLLWKCDFAYELCFAWHDRPEEFVRRAAFSLIAKIAISHKKRPDADLLAFFPLIEGAADDGRNFVKKAVNWSLRQIGKRNASLNAAAVELAEQLVQRESKSARWIARDALRELRGEAVRRRLGLA